MVRDTPTGRHWGEKNTPAPERLEQFTAGNCGKQDSPAGRDGACVGGEEVEREYTWDRNEIAYKYR